MKLRFIAICATIVVLLTVFGAAEENIEEQITDDQTVKPLAITEPPIKLVHVLNPGEREYLSPNLIGLQNIAMTFLPLYMNFLNIIDAFREVVNGVRYEIVLNAVDTKQNNTDIVCRLVILEKPWLRTEWGDKVRELVNSNCTSDAGVDDNLTDPAGRANAMNDKYPRNAVFNGGSRNELSADEMAKLESQILPFNVGGFKRTTTSKGAGATTTTSTSTTSTTTSTTTTTTTTERAETLNQQNEQSNNNKATNAGGVEEEATTLIAQLSDTEQKWFDDILSVGAINFENTRREQQQHQQAAINEARQSNFQPSAVQQAELLIDQQQQQQQQPQQQQFDTQDYVVEDSQQLQREEEQYQQQQDYQEYQKEQVK